MSDARRLLARLAVTFLALVAAGVQAGGPRGICDDASKTVLAYSPATVNLNYDQGNLGSRTKAQADAIVSNAAALWTNVPTATITIGRGIDLPADVTTVNYTTYLNNFTDGRNPVIYDTDGSITDLIFGIGAKNSTLGFAGSAWYLSSTNPSFNCRYAEGQAVINGFIPISDAKMGLVIAHEIGHLVGLDHTQLDGDQGLASAVRPLMYPFAQRGTLTLHEDDIAAVSGLYPDPTLNSVYGQLTGVFVLADGATPVRGANLWARETVTNKVYSIVSDYRTQNTGFFKLLLPPGNYELRADAIRAEFYSGSSVGPYSEVLPSVATVPPVTPEDSLSFKPPLYVGGNAGAGGVRMPTVTLGNGSPVSIAITAGCAATANFRIDGNGSVGGNCVALPAIPVCTIAPTTTSVASGTGQTFTASCTNSPTSYIWTVDGLQAASGPSASFGTGTVVPVGAHTVSVTASHAAGTSAPASASLTVIDATPPTTPGGVFLNAVSSSQITVNWTVSTDNAGVTQYRVRRNGVQVGTVTGSPPATAFTDPGLSPSTFYSYTVQACDAAGNCSVQSNAASGNTSPAVPACTISPTAATVVSGTGQIFTASCSGSPTLYVWRVDGVQVASGGAATSFNTGTALAIGAHTVSVTATNEGGVSTPTNATLNVAAPLFRAYVSSDGVDTNPCTLAAPCRLLPAALAAIVDGGEIWMLKSANYNTGPVNITKSVTILAVPGALGSVVALGGNAIDVATPGVKLALRNLVIAPAVGGGGTGGVNMTAGASLTVDNCLIANLPGNGISVAANAARLLVTDTVIRGTAGHGVHISNGARATLTRTRISGHAVSAVTVQGNLSGSTTVADIADSTLDASVNGIAAYSVSAGAAVKVSVQGSQVVRNSQNGVLAQSDSGALVKLSASNNIISNNGVGIHANKAGAQILASGNTVSDNQTGLANSAAVLQSRGDNAVRNNGANASGAISPAPEM